MDNKLYSKDQVQSVQKKSFYQMELECEYRFSQGGPYWHLCTDGTRMETIFTSTGEYEFCNNAIAVCAASSNIKILTFAIMSDHLHFILSGEKPDVLDFFDSLKKKLMRYFSQTGRSINWRNFGCEDPIPIQTLKSLRNEIVYVNRNGYVAISSVTPFSYLWGSGYLFFNGMRKYVCASKYSDLSFKQKRTFLHGRAIELPEEYTVFGNLILPDSFCWIEFAESLFRDANDYFVSLSKAYEAFSEIAKRLGDSIVLSDGEVYPALLEICRKRFRVDSPKSLSANDRIEAARLMHSQYNSSNEQIRRLLSLDIKIINELFPVRQRQ